MFEMKLAPPRKMFEIKNAPSLCHTQNDFVHCYFKFLRRDAGKIESNFISDGFFNEINIKKFWNYFTTPADIYFPSKTSLINYKMTLSG